MENKKKLSLVKTIISIINMIVLSSPVYAIFYLLLGILFGISFGVNTLVTQYFFDAVNSAINGTTVISKVILVTILLGAVIMISEILNSFYNFTFSVFETKVSGNLNKKINEKILKIDPIMFEDTELLDSINKSKKGVDGSLGLFVVITMLFTFYLPYFLFMGIYLFKLDKILLLSLVSIFIPVIITQFIRIKVFNKLENEIAPLRRECDYYESCICSREYFKETRTLGCVNYFQNLYIQSMKNFNRSTWKAEKKTVIIELIMKTITLLGYSGVIYLLFKSLLNGNITIGAFAAVFNSIGFMIIIMEEIICIQIGRLTKDIGSVINFINFFKLPERHGICIDFDINRGILLNNVSFNYPSSKKAALKNISLKIHPNETIAIVGENGSGKSTLIKLITGIYLPTEGTIEFGGVDTKKISIESIYMHTTAVFQKYQKYKMTLLENISISDILNTNNDNLVTSSCKADLKIESEVFPDGYDTMLSREFGGIDISGGQWQKIAIARAFYKNHNLIILDEPTASIDPLEETEIYKKFAKISNNKTSIIVTHRIGAAKIADRIIVMDKGEIIEIGNHKQLLCLNGKYSEMYSAQSKWYLRT